MIEPAGNNHLLYIPTHRECIAIIDQKIQEARWLAEHGASVKLCVLDNSSDSSVAERNRRFLAQRRPQGLTASFLGAPEQARIVDAILGNVSTDAGVVVDDVRALLLPEGLSYGRGPNLAALVGAALGVVAIHRRDSDEYGDAARYFDYPIQLEVAALGRRLGDVTPTPRGDISRFGNPVAMVGTSMFGRPPIDRRDLFAAGEPFETRFQQLGRPGVPETKVREEAHDYLEVEPTLRYDTDFLDSAAPDRVEMGQASVTERLYTALPEMPGGIIGTDYMQRDLAYTLGWPVLFHSRKVQHIYDDVREASSNQAAHVDYAVRDVQYIQVGRIWQQHGRQVDDESYTLTDPSGEFLPESYAASFAAAAEGSLPALQEVREGALSVYRDAARAASGGLQRRLTGAADALEAGGRSIDDGVLGAVANFCTLVRSWPHLMAAARRSQDVVNEQFSDD